LIAGCVDPDRKRRVEFQKYWGVENGYDTVAEISQQAFKFDVVSVCSPTSLHLDQLKLVLALSPALVFCEKPIGEEFNKAASLLENYSKKNISLLINYSRRFDESVDRLKCEIEIGKYGVLRSVSGYYNKGLLNNGSHFLDILRFLLGELSVDYVGRPIVDFKESDPTVPLVLLTSEGIQISLSTGNANDFSLAELTFVFSKAQVTMMDGGLNWSYRHVEKSDLYSGYQVLQAPRFETGMLLHSLENAVTNIDDVLAGRRIPLCKGEDGLKVLELCGEILSRVKNSHS
jgi:predicted dehydrogenase